MNTKTIKELYLEIIDYQSKIDKNIFEVNQKLEKHFWDIMWNKFHIYITYLPWDWYNINYWNPKLTISADFSDFNTCLENEIKKYWENYKCKTLEEFENNFINKCDTF